MEIKDVIELIKAVSDNGLTGFKIEQGDTKIVIKKEQPAVIQAVPALAGCQPADGAVPQTVQTVSGMPLNGNQGSPAPQTDTAVSNRVVACPLVGTFYSSPAPDAEDFVKVGDHVKKGQVIGIVEAMKLMNEIESEYDGVVEAILVKNEETVEYGQPLSGSVKQQEAEICWESRKSRRSSPTAIHFFWWTALRSWSRACGLLDIKQSHITSRIFPVTSRRSR